jgi:hypothetical protein
MKLERVSPLPCYRTGKWHNLISLGTRLVERLKHNSASFWIDFRSSFVAPLNRTEPSIANTRQRIHESYAAISRLCASVARADAAIAKSRRIIEQYQASVPAMTDCANEATLARTKVDHHQASRKAAMVKVIDSDGRKIAASVVQSFREAGFDCKLLSPPTLH